MNYILCKWSRCRLHAWVGTLHGIRHYTDSVTRRGQLYRSTDDHVTVQNDTWPMMTSHCRAGAGISMSYWILALFRFCQVMVDLFKSFLSGWGSFYFNYRNPLKFSRPICSLYLLSYYTSVGARLVRFDYICSSFDPVPHLLNPPGHLKVTEM